MGAREDLAHSYRNDQQQYNYYIIALAVACVGFSATITNNLTISPIMIPLGLAVLCWFITIYCGIKMIDWRLSSTYANIALIDVQEGVSELAGNHPEKMKIGESTLKEILKRNSNTMTRLGKLKINAFYMGVVFFTTWRIFTMLPEPMKTNFNNWFLNLI